MKQSTKIKTPGIFMSIMYDSNAFLQDKLLGRDSNAAFSCYEPGACAL